MALNTTIAVTTAATLLLAADATRASAEISNAGTVTLYLGPTAGLTMGTATVILPPGEQRYRPDATQTVYALTDPAQIVPGRAQIVTTDRALDVQSETAAQRNAGVAHRVAVTTADKLALPGTLTLSAITESGSTLANVAYYAGVSAGNAQGVTGPGTIPGTITPTASQAVRMAWAQVTSATYYDLFLSTAAAPLWVGRVTEAQRASGGYIISAVGVVSAGSSAAGSIDIGIVGTGQATSAAAFAYNTAYTTAGITAINCAGYSRAHILVDYSPTDLRAAPTLTIVPMTLGQVGGNWHACKPQVVSLLGGAGQPYFSDWELDADGCSGLIILIDTISGNGAAVNVNLELA